MFLNNGKKYWCLNPAKQLRERPTAKIEEWEKRRARAAPEPILRASKTLSRSVGKKCMYRRDMHRFVFFLITGSSNIYA